MRGSLSTMAFVDLLSWIHKRNKRGALTIENRDTVRTFRFRRALMVGASSNLADERLGRMLVGRGVVDEAALDHAFQVQGDTGVALGKILIMVGAIDEEGLIVALEEKIVDAVADVLNWEEGVFHFDDGGETDHVPSEFEVGVAIPEGVKRASEVARRWRTIRSVLPTMDIRLWLSDAARCEQLAGAEFAKLSERAKEGDSVREIAWALKRPLVDVAEFLASLVNERALGIERRAKRRRTNVDPPTFEELEEAARGRCQGGDSRGAYGIAKTAYARFPDEARAKVLYEDMERSLVAKLARTMLSRYRVPRRLVADDRLAAMELSPDERELTGRIDGFWDLFSVIHESSMRDGEALLTIRSLADRGIISI